MCNGLFFGDFHHCHHGRACCRCCIRFRWESFRFPSVVWLVALVHLACKQIQLLEAFLQAHVHPDLNR